MTIIIDADLSILMLIHYFLFMRFISLPKSSREQECSYAYVPCRTRAFCYGNAGADIKEEPAENRKQRFAICRENEPNQLTRRALSMRARCRAAARSMPTNAHRPLIAQNRSSAPFQRVFRFAR